MAIHIVADWYIWVIWVIVVMKSSDAFENPEHKASSCVTTLVIIIIIE